MTVSPASPPDHRRHPVFPGSRDRGVLREVLTEIDGEHRHVLHFLHALPHHPQRRAACALHVREQLEDIVPANRPNLIPVHEVGRGAQQLETGPDDIVRCDARV